MHKNEFVFFKKFMFIPLTLLNNYVIVKTLNSFLYPHVSKEGMLKRT